MSGFASLSWRGGGAEGGVTARYTPRRLHTHTPDTDLYRILTLTGKVGGGAVWVGVNLQSAWQVVWRFCSFL